MKRFHFVGSGWGGGGGIFSVNVLYMHFPIGVSVLDPATTRTRQSRVDLSPACTVVGGKKDTSVMSICFRFDWHTTPLACLRTRCNAGRRMPISSPMIATTTSSSMSVKAFALGILFSVHTTGTPDVSQEQPPRFTTFTSLLQFNSPSHHGPGGLGSSAYGYHVFSRLWRFTQTFILTLE